METASYHDILDQAPGLEMTRERASRVEPGVGADRPWIFVGCGASYHAAAAAAGLFTVLAERGALALPASDLWMNPDVWLRPDAVVVGLSRTGTTTETVGALETARRAGATTIGVSLSSGTPVVADADHAVVLDHVGEQGRVMTRSFANLLLASQVLAVAAAGRSGGRDPAAVGRYWTGTAGLSGAVADGMPGYDDAARALAKPGSSHVVFLGSGPDIGRCRQGALQTQETARPAVEAHTVLDYRHGPLASLTPESLLVLLSSERSLPADLVLAEDVRVLGGTLVVVGAGNVVDRFSAGVEKVVAPGAHPLWLRGNVALPFLQLLAYHLTVARDADPESVHNLDRAKDPHVNPHELPDDLFSEAAR